jgi:hypothetical protein
MERADCNDEYVNEHNILLMFYVITNIAICMRKLRLKFLDLLVNSTFTGFLRDCLELLRILCIYNTYVADHSRRAV